MRQFAFVILSCATFAAAGCTGGDKGVADTDTTISPDKTADADTDTDTDETGRHSTPTGSGG